MSTDPRVYEIKWRTWARWNFDFALNDVELLLNLYDTQNKTNHEKHDKSHEVLLRSGVILTVTAWETFVEDTLMEQVKARLDSASNPQDLQSTFNHVAASWLDHVKSKHGSQPTELIKWTGNGWKMVILHKVQAEALSLNTPNSNNLKVLFKKYLDLKIEDVWQWRGAKFGEVCRRLDDLIKLRGEIAHRSKPLFARKFPVRRNQLVQAIDLTKRLVQCTENALGVAPRKRNTS